MTRARRSRAPPSRRSPAGLQHGTGPREREAHSRGRGRLVGDVRVGGQDPPPAVGAASEEAAVRLPEDLGVRSRRQRRVGRHQGLERDSRVPGVGVPVRLRRRLDAIAGLVHEPDRAVVAAVVAARQVRLGNDRERGGPELRRALCGAQCPARDAATVQPGDAIAHASTRSVVARPAKPKRRLGAAAMAGHVQRSGGGFARQKQPAVESPHVDDPGTTVAHDPAHPRAHSVQGQPATPQLTALRGVGEEGRRPGGGRRQGEQHGDHGEQSGDP